MQSQWITSNNYRPNLVLTAGNVTLLGFEDASIKPSSDSALELLSLDSAWFCLCLLFFLWRLSRDFFRFFSDLFSWKCAQSVVKQHHSTWALVAKLANDLLLSFSFLRPIVSAAQQVVLASSWHTSQSWTEYPAKIIQVVKLYQKPQGLVEETHL